MNAYVDSSVLLRFVFGEPGRLHEWPKVTRALSSELIRVECLRTVDRARIQLGLDEGDVAEKRADVLGRLQAFDLVRIDARVLERAAEPFPTLVRSLDAIHLATAILARKDVPELVFATHDGNLANAARAEGFSVLGDERVHPR